MRGLGGDLIVFDEFAFVNEKIYNDIIVPVMAMKNTALLGLSTKGHRRSNFFNKLLKSPIFEVIEQKLVCAPCFAKGIRKACIHERDSGPSFRDAKNVEDLRTGEDNDAYDIEMLNLDPEEDVAQCFPTPMVREIVTRPRFKFCKRVHTIVLTIDPCGDSDKILDVPSHFAMTAIAYSRTERVIVGCASFVATYSSDSYLPKVVEMVKRVLKIQYCEDATLVLDVEVGTAHVAGDCGVAIRNALGARGKFCELTDYRHKAGRKNDNETKFRMKNITLAAMQKYNICFHEDFVTFHENREEIVNMFLKQGVAFKRIQKETANGRITWQLSGKQGKELDDLWITFMRNFLAYEDYSTDHKYEGHWMTV